VDSSTGNAASSLADALEQLMQGGLAGSDSSNAQPAGQGALQDELSLRGNTATACPDPEELAQLLAEESGAPPPANRDVLLAHVAGCGRCAGHLRTLAADVTGEEAAMLAGLSCQTEAMQRSLAERLAQTPHAAVGKPPIWTYLWLGAPLAASLLIAIGISTWWQASRSPEHLLAEAYTQSRLFELRMPGAGSAPVSPALHLRGGSAGRESSKLLEARARIERKLEASPEDAHWLQLEARSDLLEEKFDPAIAILDRLAALGPATSSLLLDDASAYFERGVATGSEEDRARALDALRRADELSPSDPVILFNEAVAMEDRGQLINAVETWNRYLRFESNAAWQAEGRQRLEAVEQKLNQLKSREGQKN
jgi:tetratricopeptide (TPR) repeat protein